MGHIQQLAFALGPIEARPAAPARPRVAGRPARAAAPPAQPLLPDVPGLVPAALAAATAPAVAAAPAAPAQASPPLPVADGPASGSMPDGPAPLVVERPLSDDAAPSPVKAALYLVIGFARGRERRRGWQRLTEQGFASRRLAEEHAARLLARGRADGALLARQELAADMDAADEPVLLARFGDLPAELLEG